MKKKRNMEEQGGTRTRGTISRSEEQEQKEEEGKVGKQHGKVNEQMTKQV